MTLRLHAPHADAIRAHGERGYPHEICGLLLGHRERDGALRVVDLFELENERTDSRENRYAVSALSIFRAEKHAASKGLEVVGYYHSHPNAPARPSGYDLEHATWPGIAYPIVSVVDGQARELTTWRLNEDRTAFEHDRLELMGTTNEGGLHDHGSNDPHSVGA